MIGGQFGTNAVILIGGTTPKPLARAYLRLIEEIEITEVVDGRGRLPHHIRGRSAVRPMTAVPITPCWRARSCGRSIASSS